MAENASLFWSYTELQRVIRKVQKLPASQELSLGQLALAGSGAGFLTSFVLCVQASPRWYHLISHSSIDTQNPNRAGKMQDAGPDAHGPWRLICRGRRSPLIHVRARGSCGHRARLTASPCSTAQASWANVRHHLRRARPRVARAVARTDRHAYPRDGWRRGVVRVQRGGGNTASRSAAREGQEGAAAMGVSGLGSVRRHCVQCRALPCGLGEEHDAD